MPSIDLAEAASPRLSKWLRLLLGHRILNGLSVGFGLAALCIPIFLIGGAAVAASASVGMLIVSIGDQTSPARGKLLQLAPLLWFAAPLSLSVQAVQLLPHHAALAIGGLVAFGGFIGMMGTAWGMRGAPVGFALLLSLIFALSIPAPTHWHRVLEQGAWFEFGAVLYAGYAVFSARCLNLRFRTQALAEALSELAAMLRRQADRFAATDDRRNPPLRHLLGEQAVLAERLQTARDLVLDRPRSTREVRLVAILIAAIRLREHALACELEFELQASRHPAWIDLRQARQLETAWRAIGTRIDRISWALFTGRTAWPMAPFAVDPTQSLPGSLREPVAAMAAESRRLIEQARADVATAAVGPDDMLAWQRFRSPMRWPLAPLKRALNGASPVLRYAVRVATALAAGYALALQLPWSTHPHWILLTIAVVMRTNIAQTIERRNARLLGTLVGCLLVTALLSLRPSVPVEFLCMAVGAGVAHGFAQVRYLVAAAGATVLALMQGQLLHTAGDFAWLERLADTLIGTALAWGFSYLLPAWERRQLPALLSRLRQAQLDHARMALTSDREEPEASETAADWRWIRREVHESLAAIANAAQRALSEPAAVQPPIDLLERIQLRSYRLLAGLGGVRSWREQTPAADPHTLEPVFAHHLNRITQALGAAPSGLPTADAAPTEASTETIDRPEGAGRLRQRLRAAAEEAAALGADLATAQAWQARRSAG